MSRNIISKGGVSEPPVPEAIGEALFKALFSGQIRTLWDRSLHDSLVPALRLQLRFELDRESRVLHSLPWELLCQPDTHDFLALRWQTSVVRYFADIHPVSPRPLQSLLRVLVVMASPMGLPALDLDQESRKIQEVWSSQPQVEVVLLTDGGIIALRETLLRESFHALHFIGHGGLDLDTGNGRLFLTGKDGLLEPISGELLATVLRDIDTLRLVFLNALDSAHSGISTSLEIATSLIMTGIRAAIVAIQFPISDSAAIAFSQVMYRQLAAGGSIEEAVTAGRQGIYANQPDSIEWASPALFTKISGQLFESPRKTPLVGQMIGASNDKVATEDRLGFLHYIKAFSDLIESIHTQLPLTIGIFGSWGMGKSFLLEHIEKELNSRQEKRHQKSLSVKLHESVVSRIYIVTFNAWEYSANETIWPGLVRKIMDRLEKEVSWPFPGRFLTKLWINLKAQLKKERIRIGTVLYLAVFTAIATFLLWSGKLPQTWKALVAAGVAGLAGGLLKLVSDTVANPLSQWLTKLFLEDDYGRHIGQLARIRKDLEFLESRLRTDPQRVERVLILIDDLDRCEPEKAVEMLQAVKLLLDFESFILFLGIDARIITRAIEKHYQGFLGEAGASGYEYLDKIVQIPFQIPAPGKDQIKEFLRYQMGDPRPATDKPPIGLTRPIVEPDSTEATRGKVPETKELPIASAVSPARPLLDLEEPPVGLSAFTHEELQVFQNMADFLRPNPRHLKRLVNVYRLVRTLADLTGERILLEKPGAAICWIILCAQWPHTAHGMLRQLDELDSQQEKNKIAETDPLRYLLAETESMLAAGSPSKRQDPEPALLHRLVDCNEARMSWEELRSIRRYTINFNPTVEVNGKQIPP